MKKEKQLYKMYIPRFEINFFFFLFSFGKIWVVLLLNHDCLFLLHLEN